MQTIWDSMNAGQRMQIFRKEGNKKLDTIHDVLKAGAGFSKLHTVDDLLQALDSDVRGESAYPDFADGMGEFSAFYQQT